MLRHMDEMTAHAIRPFAAAGPRRFADVLSGESELFDLQQARFLLEDNSHRTGELYPGHGLCGLVTGQTLADPSQYETLADARALQAAGATVIYRALHLFLPAVGEVCQQLADATGLPTHAVGYWTPVASQGFPLHADPDTVVAVHTLGRKVWAFVRPRVTRADDPGLGWVSEPTDAIPGYDQAHLVVPVDAGQAIVVPRGWGHWAATNGKEAIHVSFGLLHPEIGAAMVDRQHPMYPVA